MHYPPYRGCVLPRAGVSPLDLPRLKLTLEGILFSGLRRNGRPFASAGITCSSSGRSHGRHHWCEEQERVHNIETTIKQSSRINDENLNGMEQKIHYEGEIKCRANRHELQGNCNNKRRMENICAETYLSKMWPQKVIFKGIQYSFLSPQFLSNSYY